MIAWCSTDEVPDIGAVLVARGLAWAFIKYSTDYTMVEKGPRAQKLGIWQSQTQSPWEYRAEQWETATEVAPENCPIKDNINAKGERIYHAPWPKHYPATRTDTSKGGCWFCREGEGKGGRLAGALSIKVYLLNLAVLVTDFPLQ